MELSNFHSLRCEKLLGHSAQVSLNSSANSFHKVLPKVDDEPKSCFKKDWKLAKKNGIVRQEKFARISRSKLLGTVSFTVPNFQTVEIERVLVNSMG